MLVMAVNAAVGNQTEKMETMPARFGECFLRNLVSREFPFRDRFVDAGQVLINDPTGAEIEMAHFGVTHLSFRQPDIDTAGTQFPAGIIAVKLVVKRRAGEQGSVAILFALFAAARINAPAVANDKDYRLQHAGAFSRRSRAR